jgi:hypothetical protein
MGCLPHEGNDLREQLFCAERLQLKLPLQFLRITGCDSKEEQVKRHDRTPQV